MYVVRNVETAVKNSKFDLHYLKEKRKHIKLNRTVERKRQSWPGVQAERFHRAAVSQLSECERPKKSSEKEEWAGSSSD